MFESRDHFSPSMPAHARIISDLYGDILRFARAKPGLLLQGLLLLDWTAAMCFTINPLLRFNLWSWPIEGDFDTTRSESVTKFMWDGFSTQSFHGWSDHYFQMGFAHIRIAGFRVPNCQSRDALYPMGTAAATEDEAIPPMLHAWGVQMLEWTGEGHQNVLVKPDGSIRIKLPEALPCIDPEGNLQVIEWMRHVLSSDVKAMLLSLGRDAAGSNYYCPYNICACHKSVNKTYGKARAAPTTMGELRERLVGVEEFPTLKEWKAARTASHGPNSGWHREDVILGALVCVSSVPSLKLAWLGILGTLRPPTPFGYYLPGSLHRRSGSRIICDRFHRGSTRPPHIRRCPHHT